MHITECLLGSLPDGETERQDELDVSYNGFADALADAENNLVDD